MTLLLPYKLSLDYFLVLSLMTKTGICFDKNEVWNKKLQNIMRELIFKLGSHLERGCGKIKGMKKVTTT